MKKTGYLIKRNMKLFFKDKGMFLTSLITPMILLVLYVTFLGSVFWETFTSAIPDGLEVSENLIDALVGGQLFSSLLAVCCVTVAFCSNLLMVQDKVSGARTDLTMAPVKSSSLALGYYIASAAVTLIICLVTTGIGFLYLANIGWYFSATDVIGILLDVFLLVMFGTALSSIINFFLSSQGQISAVGTIVSAGYGFLCGAYMPISNFSEGLQKALMFIPGTYGTSLLRNHAMGGACEALLKEDVPKGVVNAIKDTVDCNLEFFEHSVDIPTMYLVMGISVIVLLAVYILMNIVGGKKRIR